LIGTHKEWAYRAQDDLEASIVANLPQLMAQTKNRDNVADSFFGMSDDLGELPTNPPVAGEPGLRKSSVSSLPPVVPNNQRWLIFAVITAAGLLAIIAAILLFVL
jgi:hypothetical protein